MAYKFQLGAMTASGSLKTEGTFECETSITVGSAALLEAELEKLDGITNGTAAANKALVLDGSKNIATIGTIGCGAITSTGNSQFARVQIDSANDYIDVDTDFKMVAAADIVLDPAGGDVKVDGNMVPNADDGGSLGSANLNWADLYLADGANIYMGDDQDSKLNAAGDNSVVLENANDLFNFQIKGTHAGANPVTMALHRSSSSPADNDDIGKIEFNGYDDGGNITEYGSILVEATDVSAGAEQGKMSFKVAERDGTQTAGLILSGLSSDGDITVDVATHDGAAGGLMLAGTLVTSTANELNRLDGVSADVTAAKLGALSALTTTEIDFIDGATAGTAAASKALVLNASGWIGGITTLTSSNISASQIQCTDLTVSSNSIIIGSTTITEAEMAMLDGITAGTAAANKAVVLDGSKNIATIGTIGCGAITSTGASSMGSLNVGGTLACDTSFTLDSVVINATELGYIDGITAGQGTASKAVVLDSNGDFEMQDSDKMFFGNDADVSIHWDGSTMKIGTDTSGAPITIGHSTSEVTIADNLTVTGNHTITGNLTVNGTTTSVNSTTINITRSFTFEGPADDYETVFTAGTPTQDLTLTMAQFSASGGAATYHIPLLADATTAASAQVTAAEYALLDGGSSVGTTALASGDGFLHNDNGTMKQTSIDKIADFFAGDGLAASSGVLAVSVDDSGIEINSDTLRLKDNGVTLAKMAGLARGKFIVGDASGDPSALSLGTAGQFLISDSDDPIWRSMSGDATLGADGQLTIANDAIESGMLNDNIISGQTELGAGAIVNADEMLISDGGTLKKIGVDNLKSYMNGQTIHNVDDGGTLVVGFNYWSDLGGAESATLPASPSVGDVVYVKAPSNCSSTNTVQINTGAGDHKIDGDNAIVLESPYAAVSLCYVVADHWRIF